MSIGNAVESLYNRCLPVIITVNWRQVVVIVCASATQRAIDDVSRNAVAVSVHMFHVISIHAVVCFPVA